MAGESRFRPDYLCGEQVKPARLRILATSDLHAHITPWDYHANRPTALTGLARTASLIAQARTEVECCLLVDNGDFLQGSPLGDVEALREGGSGGHLHPMIAAMNALGYDAATLGNHEFSQGLEFLLRQLAGAQFPVISANLVRKLGANPLDDVMLVPPTLMIEKMLSDPHGILRPLRIGIIGFAPPETPQWDSAKLGGTLQGRDILEAAAAHLPRLLDQGADLVLALSHSGIGASVTNARAENASTALAAMPGIDLLVAGHTHQTFPAPDFPSSTAVDAKAGLLWGKPAVMPGFHGSHLGVIDVDLVWTGLRWHIVRGTSALRPIARRGASGKLRALTQSAPAILALARPAHEATRVWARRTVGHTLADLHSYFAMIAPSPAVRLVARAQAAFVVAALRDGPHAHLPVLSGAAPFSAGGRGGPENYTHIPAGRLTMRHVFDLYPHPNTIAAVLTTGATIKAALERSFSQFRAVVPGSYGGELLDPDFPSFNFSQIEGLSWQVDLSYPARTNSRGEVIDPQANRVKALTYNGQLVAPDEKFVVASNSYRAVGGGGFTGLPPESLILLGSRTSRDVLIDHIATEAVVGAQQPPNWRFQPMPGTSVLFDSAPAAARHLADLAPLAAEPLGLTPQGFRRFRLHL